MMGSIFVSTYTVRTHNQKERKMTRETYYEAMSALAPTNGEMPMSYKQHLTRWMRENPGVDLSPATEKELLAITNYLNHTSLDCDLFGDKLPFARYKDAVLCLNFEHTEWVLLERRPEDQLWDLLEYSQQVKPDRAFSDGMRNIFSLKTC